MTTWGSGWRGHKGQPVVVLFIKGHHLLGTSEMIQSGLRAEHGYGLIRSRLLANIQGRHSHVIFKIPISLFYDL